MALKDEVDKGIFNRLEQIGRVLWASYAEHLPGVVKAWTAELEKQAPKP
jgi:hypothetical protein